MKDFATITYANCPSVNDNVKVRLYSHKWFRHYGGREITTTAHLCSAAFIKYQEQDHTYVVEILEDCAGYKKGHKIAVMQKDFNI
jgi:hypothetical protein